MRFSRVRVQALVFLCLVAMKCACAAEQQASIKTEMSFDMVHGAVIVSATLDGRGPFAMVLDTGADPSVVDIQTARGLGMKIASKGEQGVGTGAAVNLTYSTSLATVTLGSIRVENVDALAMDLSGLSKALGVPIQGVLGRSFMKGRAFQIDYPKHVVRFYTGSALRRRHAAPDTAQRTTLSYRYRDDLLLSGVTINGKAAIANLDTGSNGTFQFSPKAVDILGLAADANRGVASRSTGFNGDAENRTGQVDKVEVGSISIDHPPVVFYGKGTGRDDVAWSVRIGSAFLKDFVVTVDDLSHLVRIEKP